LRLVLAYISVLQQTKPLTHVVAKLLAVWLSYDKYLLQPVLACSAAAFGMWEVFVTAWKWVTVDVTQTESVCWVMLRFPHGHAFSKPSLGTFQTVRQRVTGLRPLIRTTHLASALLLCFKLSDMRHKSNRCYFLQSKNSHGYRLLGADFGGSKHGFTIDCNNTSVFIVTEVDYE
jgi:hypothetical protein